MKNKFLVKFFTLIIVCFVFVFGVNKSYAKHAWHENSEGRWYESEDDKGNYIYFTNGWKKIDSKYYYFNKAGYVLTGKNKINGKYYYLNKPKGYRIENQWVGDYYFGKDGVMLTNTTTPDGYKVDKNGKWITNRWLEFSDHWEYMYADGSKAKNKFEKIYEKTYYFNSKGHMVTGWEMINKNWYYFYDSGSMAKNEWVGSYYLGSNGKMLVNTITPDGYRVDKNGKWITDRWLEFSDHWEYMYADGSKAKNKFEKIYGEYYYFDSKGHMVTGWEMINKNWYYFYDGGSMAKNEWVGSYYLGSNGKMLVNTITPDGYRVNSYGACVGGVWKLQNGYWIYKYDDGVYAKDGWRRISGEWYYFNSKGRLLTNTITPDGYRVDSNGETDNYIRYYMASKEVQMRILNAAYNTSSPGINLCAMWVSRVYQNAGLGYLWGNANDMYRKYTFTSDIGKLKIGMIVAVESSSGGGIMGRIYGHVGIYIGDGKVMESVGYKRIITLNDWISECCQHHPVGFGYPPSVEK